jgi:hypothetical protein
MRSMVKPIEMKNSTLLTRAGFTCLKFICRCALLQAASCSQRQLLYLRFPGQYNLGLRRGYVKGQIENILILRCTHLNLSGKRYPESSTRPFDAVGTTRSVSRKPNSTPPAGTRRPIRIKPVQWTVCLPSVMCDPCDTSLFWPVLTHCHRPTTGKSRELVFASRIAAS